MVEYWIPPELWRIVKNFLLSKKYWMRKFNTVLSSIPSPKKITPTLYTSATQLIRFTKTFERHLYFFKRPRIGKIMRTEKGYTLKSYWDGKIPNIQRSDNIYERLTVVYSLFSGYDDDD